MSLLAKSHWELCQNVHGYTDDLTIKQFGDHVTDRGFPVEKGGLRLYQENMLKVVVLGEYYAYARGLPLTWTLVSRSIPVQIISEMVMVHCENEILFCFPFFPSPRDTILKVLFYDLQTGKWRDLATHGEVLDPFSVFRKMPHHFVYQKKLYLAWSQVQPDSYHMACLDLQTGEWTEVVFRGAAPITGEYVDGCFYADHFYVLDKNHQLWSLDVNQAKWTQKPTTGTPNDFPNSSSILHDRTMYTFDKEGQKIYGLNLETFVWSQYPVGKPPTYFLSTRHSHLIRTWRLVATIGKRPHGVKTEATCVIVGGVIYIMAGQGGKNHLLSLDLKCPPSISTPNSKISPVLNRMWSDDFKDVVILAGTHELKAHKSLLRSQSGFFKRVLQADPKLQQIDMAQKIENFDPEIFYILFLSYYDMLDFSQVKDMEALFLLARELDSSRILTAIMDWLSEDLTCAKAIVGARLAYMEGQSDNGMIFLEFLADHMASVSFDPEFIRLCQDRPNFMQGLFTMLDQLVNTRPGRKITVRKFSPSASENPFFHHDFYFPTPKHFFVANQSE